MKKLLTVVLAVALICTFAACGGETPENPNPPPNNNNQGGGNNNPPANNNPSANGDNGSPGIQAVDILDTSNYYFIYKDKKVSLGMTVGEVLAFGTLTTADVYDDDPLDTKTAVMPPRSYTSLDLYGEEFESWGMYLRIENTSDEPLPLEQAVIVSIDTGQASYTAYDELLLTFAGGLRIAGGTVKGSTTQEVKAAFGEPQTELEEDNNIRSLYYRGDTEQSYSVSVADEEFNLLGIYYWGMLRVTMSLGYTPGLTGVGHDDLIN